MQKTLIFNVVDMCLYMTLFGGDHLKHSCSRLGVFTLADESLTYITIIRCLDIAFINGNTGGFNPGFCVD